MSDTLRLFCLVRDDDPRHVFAVDIAGDKTVYHLKETIKEKKQQVLFRDIDADTLKILKVDVDLSKDKGASFKDAKFKDGVDGVKELWATELLSNEFPGPDGPKIGHLHIIVERPAKDQHIHKRVRIEGDARQNKDVTSEILSRWLPGVISLPTVANLARFLDEPFHERAKIPLDRYRFEMFISSPMQLSDRIQRQDIEMIFRMDDHERAEGLYALFYQGFMANPPNNDATESAFHSFWDSNIRRILETLIPDGTSIRDSDRRLSTAAQRPDFGFLYLNVCPFRGEEKSPTNPEDPRAELSKKMIWTYDPAPYVLGYYATGTMVTLSAICRPLPGSREPQIVDIIKVDLRPKANRIRNLVRFVNFCSLIVPITTIIGSRITSEFLPIRRDDKTTEVCGTNIKKTYDGPQRHVRIQKLKNVYKILREKAVPNVDRIALSYSDDDHGAVAFLEPKGINVMPKTIWQVLEAVGCILDALIVMHEEPKPIFHRDIRWPNVVKCADDPRKWFLIDWDDAATPPTVAAKHLDKRCHAPAVFKDKHGPEVDVWAVGMLIIQSSRFFPRFPSDLLAIGESMKSGALNVRQSIDKILALKAVTQDE